MRSIRTTVVVVGIGVLAVPSVGQDEQPTATPQADAIAATEPTALAIIDRFIEVTGGRAAWESMESLRGLGTLEVAAANMSGSLAMFQTREGFRMSIDAGGSGAQVTIRRGDEAWQIRPDGSTQQVTGGALQKLLRDRSFNPLIDADTLYASMELSGIEDVGGKPAWKVRCLFADEAGVEEVRFFDVATGLQVKIVEQGSGQAAAFPTEIFLADYRQVGPIKVAFETTISMARSSVQISLQAMQANVAVPSCLFDFPAGPIEPVPEQAKKPESPTQTIEAFLAVDLDAMRPPEIIHWLPRLEAAKRAVDPADPNAKAILEALSQFHAMCVERVRG